MKKCIAAILAFIYLGTSSGATVNMHYCMGENAGCTLLAHESDNCDKCGIDIGKEKAENCCKDEKKIL